MTKYVLLTGFAVILASCASVSNNYVPKTEQISFPSLNVAKSATIGDEMLRQGTSTTTQGVLLYSENNIMGQTLSAGFYPKKGEDEKYVFTSFAVGNAPAGIGRINLGGGLVSVPTAIRFSKSDQQTCIIAPNQYGIDVASCDTEYAYEFTERPILAANNFQQTLIYSGRVGDRIKISYREFSGDTARPAFSNEAEYDLASSSIIAYRGARIRVIEADNQSIQYEVLANFNTP